MEPQVLRSRTGWQEPDWKQRHRPIAVRGAVRGRLPPLTVSPAEFLSFYGLLNFYLYTLAFVYSPSKNALYGKLPPGPGCWADASGPPPRPGLPTRAGRVTHSGQRRVTKWRALRS